MLRKSIQIIGVFLLLGSLFIGGNAAACAPCAKGKSGMQKPASPGAGGSGVQGARVVGVSTTGQRPASFNDGFFKSVGEEGRGVSSQPVAVPNGDGDEYKVIFR